MKVLVFLSILIVSLSNFSPSSFLSSDNINLTITNIRSLDGNINIAVFTNQENFKKEEAVYHFKFSKENVLDGTLKTKISIPMEGVYGIALLDDENENDEMDYRWLLPKEGFGFSNYYHKALSHPKFESFKFYLEKDEVKDIEMKIRYM